MWWYFHRTKNIRLNTSNYRTFLTLCIPRLSVCPRRLKLGLPWVCLSSVADWSDHMCSNTEHTVSSSAVWRHWRRVQYRRRTERSQPYFAPSYRRGIFQDKPQKSVTAAASLVSCNHAGFTAVAKETQRGTRGRQRRKQGTASATSKAMIPIS